MAGDDSFHAHCFKCKICKKRIDELTYARTSHGIYCMDCHNDRVARNRRHAQKKAEMAAFGNGGNMSTKSRNIEAKNFDQEIERPHSSGQNRTVSSRSHGAVTSSLDGDDHPQRADASGKTKTSSYISDAFFPSDKNLSTDTGKRGLSGKLHSSSSSSLNAVPRPISSGLERSNQNALFVPQSFVDPVHVNKRKSLNDGIRPLDVVSKNTENSATGKTNGELPISSVSIDGPHPTRPLKSSSQQRLDEAYSATTLPHSQASPVNEVSKFMQHELHDGVVSVPPSHRSSSRQSYGMEDNTFLLNPDSRPRHLTTQNAVNGRNSPSSAAQADVPRSVESETDNEMEIGANSSTNEVQLQAPPPPPPPKDDKTCEVLNAEASDFEPDASTTSYDSTNNETDILPATRAPHTAYVVPALPPIRFSMNSADFTDLLNTVSGLRSRDAFTHSEPNGNDMVPQSNPGTRITKQATERAAIQSPQQMIEAVISTVSESKGNGLKPNPTGDVITSEFRSMSEVSVVEGLSSVPVGSPSTFLDSVTPPSITNGAAGAMSNSSDQPAPPLADEGTDTILLRLKDVLLDVNEDKILLDRKVLESVLSTCETQHAKHVELKARLDGIKRTSKQYIEGLTVAQAEYDRELKVRRDAEAEVTRLRVLLSAQTARLTALSSDNRRQEERQKSVKDIHDNLLGLENDLSRLIVQRDIVLAEVQELLNVKSTSPASIIRTLGQNMDNLRSQYQTDLVPLRLERQTLVRETAELRITRNALLEETAALNVRNEGLAILNQEYLRRMETHPSANMKDVENGRGSQEKGRLQHQQTTDLILPPTPLLNLPSFLNEEEPRSKGSQRTDGDAATPSKKFKWPGYKIRDTPQVNNINDSFKSKPRFEHNFIQISILRFTRCDRCGDKMWGSQLRCTLCNMSIHVRCVANLHALCAQNTVLVKDDHVTPAQSLFGKDLTEQATADCSRGDYFVPHIVDKCIDAIEALALDYEGIYRKTGGAGQSRLITQLFERGNYSAFDLRDQEQFPDICSVTSVLKNYFRDLPVPLLTFDLYEDFISATQIPDPESKRQTMQQLLKKLPRAHFHTLRKLMLHLHCIHENSDKNRMNARNLGVVFGPTLMKSRHPGAEFSDMAGKSLSIEWLVENAVSVFYDPEPHQ
ncbi:hypothetical protein AX15_007086 [Amanita polypyramis BW_CC]|nr:hypothetical protein AX15_007086 [Amanita polypyramis BW_CC]